jgi:threonine dehydratase
VKADEIKPGMEKKDLCMLRESLPVTFADISRAHVAIKTGVERTKATKSYFLSELIGANIFLKPEFRQFTGSFKERGARNALLQLLRDLGDEIKQKGAICASAGNHAVSTSTYVYSI